MKQHNLFLVVAFLVSILSGRAQTIPTGSLYQHPQLPKHLQNYEVFIPNNQIQNKLQENWDANGLLRIGYLPVTLFGASSGGNANANANAIEDAIRFARDWNYVVYIPAGTYKISRTISASLQSFKNPNNKPGQYRNDRAHSIQIVGGRNGNQRAVLKLASTEGKFHKNDPKHKDMAPLLQAYAELVSATNNSMGLCNDASGCTISSETWRKNINVESSSSNFNMVIRDVVFDVRNHSSAVGVRFAGAQGCSMENCLIKAEGAYAGLTGGLGSGGGYFNCTVEGGKHGFVSMDPRITQEMLMVGMRFIDQTDAVFSGPTYKGHALIGLYIKKDTPRIFDDRNNPDHTLYGRDEGFVDQKGISIVDALIDIEGGDDPADALFWIHKSNNIYLENVHIRGKVTAIVRGTNGNKKVFLDKESNESPYAIGAFAHHKANNNDQFVIWDSSKDPKKSPEDVTIPYNPIMNPPSAPWEVINKHVNPIKKDLKLPFKAIISTNEVNTKAYTELLADDVFMLDPALGIDKNPDHSYVQTVLNNIHNESDQVQYQGKERVFIPRGVYYMDNSLILRAESKLLGTSKVNSVIRAKPEMHTKGYTAPLVTTEALLDGKALLADVFLQDQKSDYQLNDPSTYNNDMSFLFWKQGEGSVVANVVFGDYSLWDKATHIDRFKKYFVRVGSGGGGKWYGVHGTHTQLRFLTKKNNFRAFIADGASNLNLYSMNFERYGTSSPASAQSEIRNSNNVSIYLFKTETGGGTGSEEGISTPLRITNSNTVAVHNTSGRIETMEQGSIVGALVDVNNSVNIKITSARAFSIKGPQYTIKVDGFPSGTPESTDAEYVLYNDASKNIKNGFVSAFWHLPEVPYNSVVEDTNILEEDTNPILYPNPASTVLNVDLNGEDIDLISKTVGVHIVDMSGNVHYDNTIQGIGASAFSIDISGLIPGAYMLVIGEQAERITKHFVVE